MKPGDGWSFDPVVSLALWVTQSRPAFFCVSEKCLVLTCVCMLRLHHKVNTVPISIYDCDFEAQFAMVQTCEPQRSRESPMSCVPFFFFFFSFFLSPYLRAQVVEGGQLCQRIVASVLMAHVSEPRPTLPRKPDVVSCGM